MGQSFQEKLDGVISFYGKKKLLQIFVNAFVPNRSSLKVAFNKANYNDYFYLRRRYASKVKKNNIQQTLSSVPKTEQSSVKTVWTMWLQGEDQAPEIVKACWNSVRSNLPDGYKLVILDKSSLNEYAKLPDYIEKHFAAGKIKMAHYSDIARLKLLIDHGGYWIDSTVYCTNPDLFNFLDKAKPSLFVYRNMLRGDDACALSNWLIYATPENLILKNLYNLLLDYWLNYNQPRNYFLFHILFKIVVDELTEEWDKVPVMNNVNPHVLAGELFKVYDEDYFKLLGRTSSFHKLTYRLKVADMEKKNTYYHYIISKELGGK